MLTKNIFTRLLSKAVLLSGMLLSSQAAEGGMITDATGTRDIKWKIMEKVKGDLTRLAHYLGYGWVAGCGYSKVGEGYDLIEWGYRPRKRLPCKGFKGHQRKRLTIAGYPQPQIS